MRGRFIPAFEIDRRFVAGEIRQRLRAKRALLPTVVVFASVTFGIFLLNPWLAAPHYGGLIGSPHIQATQVSVSVFGRTETYIMIDWTRTGDFLFLRYEIYARPSGGSYGQMNFYITNPDQRYALLSWYTDSGGNRHNFVPGGTYYFKVRDVDSLGYSDSTESSYIVSPIPHVSMLSNSPPGIQIGWTSPYFYGAGYFCWFKFADYQVQRSTTGAGNSFSTVQTIYNVNTVSFTDTSPLQGQDYYYRVIFYANVVGVSNGTVIIPVGGMSDTLGPVQIPEFPTLLLPVMGSMVVIVAAVSIRKRRQS